MDIKYKLTHEQYEQYQQELRREKGRKPLNILFTAVLSAMPPVLAAYLIATGMVSGFWAVLCALLSLALGAVNLLARTSLWQKGKIRIALPGGKGEIGEDFWKEHKLSFDEEGVRLSSGGYKSAFSWVSFGGFKEYEGLLVPIFNAQPLDIIPLQATERFGGAEGFQIAFTDAAKAGMRSETAEGRANLPKEPLCYLEYRYSRASYVRDQRDARRARYRTKLIFNKSTLAKLMLTLVMIYAIATAQRVGAIVLYAALILIFNYEHIATFTGLLARRLDREMTPVVALRPDTRAQLFVIDEGITVVGDCHYMELPWRDIQCMRTTKHAAALYLVNQTILTVPAPPESDSAAFARFLELVRAHTNT